MRSEAEIREAIRLCELAETCDVRARIGPLKASASDVLCFARGDEDTYLSKYFARMREVFGERLSTSKEAQRQ